VLPYAHNKQFYILCLGNWPLNGCEAGGDLVLIQPDLTALLFFREYEVVLMLTRCIDVRKAERCVCYLFDRNDGEKTIIVAVCLLFLALMPLVEGPEGVEWEPKI